MSLLTDYQVAIPVPRRTRLSNITDASPGAPDVAFEAIIATQAEGLFRVYALADYDSANARHVALGVKTMLALIKFYITDDDKAVTDLDNVLIQLNDLGESLQGDEEDFAAQ